MTDLERINDSDDRKAITRANALTSLEVYDKYGAMAYGIILQIVPQPHLAQEILVSVFSSSLLQSCNSYPFSFAVCVIKLARAKAIEAKRKMDSNRRKNIEVGSNKNDQFPQLIFELAFHEGYSPDEIAEHLDIPKAEVLKAFHEFFKSYCNS